jgi:putative protein-disulfide isomerase
MPVRVRYLTDPVCPDSWAAEPALRALMVEFGADLSFTWLMAGLARDFAGRERDQLRACLDAGAGGMPVDPRLWLEAPPRSSYPACMAVKAAAEQGSDAGYACLRSLREGLLCLRRRLDGSEALVESAREAGLDGARFRIDLGSHAIVEAFGADLEESRALAAAAGAGDRLPLPSLVARGEDGEERRVIGPAPLDAWREAVEACGARPADGPRPAPADLLRRFRRVAAPEVEAACDLPGPRAAAELWRLVGDWRARPLPVLGGWLFEAA